MLVMAVLIKADFVEPPVVFDAFAVVANMSVADAAAVVAVVDAVTA